MRSIHLLCLGLLIGAPACTETGQILGLNREAGRGGAALHGSGGAQSNGGSAGAGQNLGSGGSTILNPGPKGSALVVSAGAEHSCAVVDGSLYCWGDNQAGALGLGDVERRLSPTRVGSAESWTEVGAGSGFSCGIQSGELYCWGEGDSGQLGSGQFAASLSPTIVSLPEDAASLSVGFSHACAITVSRSLYCWGQNSEGQLAQDDPFPDAGVNSSLPLQVGDDNWQQVSAGQGHTCGIQTDGSLHCWGRNSESELGLGPTASLQIRRPTQVGVFLDWIQVAAGQNHTCGIRGSGGLYCWGDNSNQQLMRPLPSVIDAPVDVSPFEGVIQIDVDTFHSCALGADGKLSCSGRNTEGQLGNGNNEPLLTLAAASPSGNYTQIATGRFHTCAARDGAVYCTGANAQGELGQGHTERSNSFSATVF